MSRECGSGRQCSRCKLVKPLTAFAVARRLASGVQHHRECKGCRNELRRRGPTESQKMPIAERQAFDRARREYIGIFGPGAHNFRTVDGRMTQWPVETFKPGVEWEDA